MTHILYIKIVQHFR